MKLSVRRILKTAIVTLAIAYVVILVSVSAGQHKSQYQPKIKTEPQFLEVSNNLGAEIIKYKTYDGLELSNLYYPSKKGKPIFLYFNGNAGVIEGAYEKFKPFIDEGYGAFFVVYRGFGANEGIASEINFFQDAEGVYNLLLEMGYREKDIMIYGYSLGTGVAVYLSSQKPRSKLLIVEGAFTSAEDVAKNLFPYLPVSSLLLDKYQSDIYIQSIDRPKLHLHGNADFKVPYKFGRGLYKVAPDPKQFNTFDEGTHGNLQELGSTKVIREFIENY